MLFYVNHFYQKHDKLQVHYNKNDNKLKPKIKKYFPTHYFYVQNCYVNG